MPTAVTRAVNTRAKELWALVKRICIDRDFELTEGTGTAKDKTWKAKFQNTYQLDPVKKFNHLAAKKILEEILDSYFEGEYNQFIVGALMKASDEAKMQLKRLDISPRYKLVVWAGVVENQRQGCHVISVCCSDKNRDNFIDAWRNLSHQSGRVWMAVYAMYCE